MNESRICMVCESLIPENDDVCPLCTNVCFENELPKEE